MIRLQNVSKFYYSKGMISSGISRVNLEFNIGEFVVITGESGSGKSTLLNVISGLDSYEEGEMYIEGKETSHYSEKDIEEFRRKYIGNIFQNYNLVNSYTVYQNVELVLLINGYSKNEIKEKVSSIIEKVGLKEFSKTKVSKLSGGQRQRVSIARALAKETAIIVADEPTGNLDSKSAESIVELLKEISKDKLVVVVTHNFDQFEKHATRKIKMHDGSVIEDTYVIEPNKDIKAIENKCDNMSNFNKLRIGVRNSFNLISKFVLLLVVFSFLIFSITSQYTSVQQSDSEQEIFGQNQVFSNNDSTRIIVKKENNKEFTEEDYKKINKITKVEKVVKEDILLDNQISIESKGFYANGVPSGYSNFKGKVDIGKMPTNKDEILVGISKDSPDKKKLENLDEESIKVNIYISGQSNFKAKVVGVTFIENDNPFVTDLYISDNYLAKINTEVYVKSSKVEYTADEKIQKANGAYLGNLKINEKVPDGKVYLPETANYLWSSQSALYKNFNINVKNIYFEDNLKTTVARVYKKSNYKDIFGKKYNEYDNSVYINSKDFEKLFLKGNFQSSVFVKDRTNVDEVEKQLQDMHFTTLSLKKAVVTMETASEVFSLVRMIFSIIMTIAIFFIVYFVIRLIMKSRNTYYATLRMLGLPQKITKRLLDIELMVDATVAYIIFIIFVNLNKIGMNLPKEITDLVKYLEVKDYFLLYAVIIILVYLISNRFARTLFKSSAMSAYRGEA